MCLRHVHLLAQVLFKHPIYAFLSLGADLAVLDFLNVSPDRVLLRGALFEVPHCLREPPLILSDH
jgi:hypothetical protein